MKQNDILAAIGIVVILFLEVTLPIFTGDAVDKLIQVSSSLALIGIGVGIWFSGDVFTTLSKSLVTLVCIGIVLGHPIYRVLWSETITITVTNTASHLERLPDGQTKDRYMVWGKEPGAVEAESFINVDEIIPFMKYESSDVQGALEIGGTYKVRVTGIRFALFSWYRNIISVKEAVSAPTS